ncbi:hypothetical protein D3C81_2235390 [compost metagenome]
MDNVIISEAVVERRQDGVKGEDKEADEPRRYEHVHVERLPPAFTLNHGHTNLSSIKFKRFNFCCK